MIYSCVLDFLAGEMLLGAEKFLKDNIHPTVIIGAYRKALDDAVTMAKEQIRLDSTLGV